VAISTPQIDRSHQTKRASRFTVMPELVSQKIANGHMGNPAKFKFTTGSFAGVEVMYEGRNPAVIKTKAREHLYVIMSRRNGSSLSCIVALIDEQSAWDDFVEANNVTEMDALRFVHLNDHEQFQALRSISPRMKRRVAASSW
jgi:hypothetical protein